jgi:plastocyanin
MSGSGRMARAALLGGLCTSVALAGTVTVSINTKSGASPQDTIVVFDPLDTTPAPSHASAVVDQVNRTFVPRVSVIRTGTAVSFPNSDHIRHQVYSFSTPRPFTLKLYAGSPRTDVVFDKPGLVVLGCNIHDGMAAFVAVVDSPYFTKIPAAGTADLNVPPGHYRLRVWHPSLVSAVEPRTVAVDASPMTVSVSIDIDAAQSPALPWPE